MKKWAKILIFLGLALIVFVSLTYCFVVLWFLPKHRDVIIEKANLYNVDKNLVLAIAKKESKFDENALSSAGAMGIMQIMPRTALWISEEIGLEDFEISDLNNAEINIEMGVFYLSYLSKKFNNLSTIICAYNAGETTVLNWLNSSEYSGDGKTLNKIPYKETENYLKGVIFNLKVYQLLS